MLSFIYHLRQFQLILVFSYIFLIFLIFLLQRSPKKAFRDSFFMYLMVWGWGWNPPKIIFKNVVSFTFWTSFLNRSLHNNFIKSDQKEKLWCIFLSILFSIPQIFHVSFHTLPLFDLHHKIPSNPLFLSFHQPLILSPFTRNVLN